MRRILALLTSALFAGAALAETSSWSSKGGADAAEDAGAKETAKIRTGTKAP